MRRLQPGVAPAIGPGIIIRPGSGQSGCYRHVLFNLFIDNRGRENQRRRAQRIATGREIRFGPRGSQGNFFVVNVDTFNAFEGKIGKTVECSQDTIFDTPFGSGERYRPGSTLNSALVSGASSATGDISQTRRASASWFAGDFSYPIPLLSDHFSGRREQSNLFPRQG